MASKYVCYVASNVCLVLCFFVILSSSERPSPWNKTAFKDNAIYFISQSASKPEIQAFSVRKVTHELKGVKLSQTVLLTCKLFQRASLAMILIALSGDIELNPGFKFLNDIKKNRGLKIAHLNVRSLRNKIDQIRLEVLSVNSLDVLTLSETWLDSTILNSEIHLPGYSCARRDRHSLKSGGGTIIYLRDGLQFRVRGDLNTADNECTWVEIIRKNCKPLLICCIYRPPDQDCARFISELGDCLSKIDLDKCELILLGDFNVDQYNGCKQNKQKLMNFARSVDMSQIITEPTRITSTTRSLIDLVFVNNQHRIVDSGVVSLSLSDHSLVYCVVKSGVKKAPPRTIEYRSYKSFNANTFIQDLNNVPWHVVESESDIDSAVLIWNKLFCDIADAHAPVKRRRVKGTQVPWMNSKISEAMQDRDYHHRKAVKSNKTYHWNMYKKLRNFVNKEVKSAKSKHYCELIEQSKGDSSRIWKAVNEVSSRDNKSSTPQYIVTDGVKHSDPKSIATALNTYFASVGKSLAAKFTTVSQTFTASPTPVPETMFELEEVQESYVLAQLQTLKTNKAIGLDKISARLLKSASCSISKSVTRLLNFSIKSNHFPKIWKCAKVTALFKSGERSNPTNYHPISV